MFFFFRRIFQNMIQAPNLAKIPLGVTFLKKIRWPPEILRWRPFFKMAAILAHNLHILLHNLTTVTDLGDIGVKK